MCGRYCLDTPRAELQLLLSSWLRPDDSAWLEHYAPRELIRPHEPVLAVRREHGEDHLAHMLWGLLPGWVKTRCRRRVRSMPAPKPLRRKPPFEVHGVITAAFCPARAFSKRGT